MGAFFTNVQLKTSDLDPSNLIEKVIHCISQINDEAGFVRVDGEDEADKTVIIFPSDDLSWVSIYDEETEDQNVEQLDKLASNLSKALQTTALSILVHDSDAVYVGIFANGALKDSISNLNNEIDFNQNKPGVWSDVLVNKYSFKNIVTAWEEKDIFIEDFLIRFAELTKLDVAKLLTGYEYINEEHPNAGIRLNFAQKNKNIDSGLTTFSMLSGIPLVDVKAGATQEAEWILTNHGKSSTGIDVIITGESIENELVIPEILKTSYVAYTGDEQKEYTVSFIKSVATTGEKMFYARIEDLYIPEGARPSYPMSPKEANRYRKIADDCAIRFNIRFMGGKEGSGNFNIFFSPINNRQDGSYYEQVMKGSLEDFLKKNT